MVETPRPPLPPLEAVDLLAQIASRVRTENIQHSTVLHEFTRVREVLTWIDESGGWTDELKRHFAQRMQFYD
jgi:ABC-type sulfate transport system substrate-binding protein